MGAERVTSQTWFTNTQIHKGGPSLARLMAIIGTAEVAGVHVPELTLTGWLSAKKRKMISTEDALLKSNRDIPNDIRGRAAVKTCCVVWAEYSTTGRWTLDDFKVRQTIEGWQFYTTRFAILRGC